MELTNEQRWQIWNFVNSLDGFTRDEYWASYQNWWRGGRGWDCLQLGGTGQMRILMWYQHRYKPNSREWRPKIIIEALLKSATKTSLFKREAKVI
jgi:hypothetical protein